MSTATWPGAAIQTLSFIKMELKIDNLRPKRSLGNKFVKIYIGIHLSHNIHSTNIQITNTASFPLGPPLQCLKFSFSNPITQEFQNISSKKVARTRVQTQYILN